MYAAGRFNACYIAIEGIQLQKASAKDTQNDEK